MLVLSRKIDQRIRIGNEIEVAILGIDGDHVKIGIQAPREITVLRYELLEDVREENRRAAAGVDAPIGFGSVFQGIGLPGRSPGTVPAAKLPGRVPALRTLG